MSDATTFLDLTNRTLNRLRDEAVDSLPTYGDRRSNPRVSTIMDFVNEATHEVLYDYHWPFNWFAGFQLPFYAPIRGDGALVARGFPSVTTSPPLTSDEVDLLAGGTQVWQFVVENDEVLPQQSYQIKDASTTNPCITLNQDYRGEDVKNDASWVAYNNKHYFPLANAYAPQAMIAVNDEDRPLSLSFVDRPDPFDLTVPRQHRSSGNPTHVVVRTATSMFQDAGLTGGGSALEMVIFPYPDKDIVLTCLVQPSFLNVNGQIRMQNATDTLHAVPERVLNLIVELAYVKALESDVQNDPERAFALRAVFNRNVETAARRSDPMPMQSRENKPFARRAGHNRDVRRGWARQEVRKL